MLSNWNFKSNSNLFGAILWLPVEVLPLNDLQKVKGYKMARVRRMVKMQSIIKTGDGNKITIHFVYNVITGEFDDFKFK